MSDIDQAALDLVKQIAAININNWDKPASLLLAKQQICAAEHINNYAQEKLRQQREDIKKEVIASVSLPFKIHMEGVFAVIESRINATIDNNGEEGR